jgi:hypothetical protein
VLARKRVNGLAHDAAKLHQGPPCRKRRCIATAPHTQNHCRAKILWLRHDFRAGGAGRRRRAPLGTEAAAAHFRKTLRMNGGDGARRGTGNSWPGAQHTQLRGRVVGRRKKQPPPRPSSRGRRCCCCCRLAKTQWYVQTGGSRAAAGFVQYPALLIGALAPPLRRTQLEPYIVYQLGSLFIGLRERRRRRATLV